MTANGLHLNGTSILSYADEAVYGLHRGLALGELVRGVRVLLRQSLAISAVHAARTFHAVAMATCVLSWSL